MNNAGITNTLQLIYDQLPLYAEEGGEAESVNIRNKLSDILNKDTQLETSILLVERIYTASGLLDNTLLENGLWRFNSFPAFLMAKSLLSTLMDPKQAVFDTGFWGAHSAYSDTSERQRGVLNYLETHRQKNHQEQALPIRYVHVAWGLIVVDGNVLLRHREDQTRTGLNNYVLIGGRLSQNDLTKAGVNENALSLLQSPMASNNTDAIEVALKREIHEETGLDFNTHYNFIPWRTIKPYTAVEGAGANHALTEYRIHVHHIELTLDGLLALSKSVEEDKNLTWFTLDELEQAKTVDGKMAYIDALIADYPSNEEWQAAVKNIEPSYQGAYPLTEDTNAITLPKSPNQPILYGKTGKERVVDLDLDQDEHSLLTSLCIYAKEQTYRVTSDKVKALPEGWLEVNDVELQSALKKLSVKLRQADCPIIEGYKEQFYRIALEPDQLYFDESMFTYRIENKAKYELVITRASIKTPWLTAENMTFTKSLSNGLSTGLANIAKGNDIDLSVMETINKGLRRDLGPLCRSMGLRRLVRTINNTPTIAIASQQPLSA